MGLFAYSTYHSGSATSTAADHVCVYINSLPNTDSVCGQLVDNSEDIKFQKPLV